MRKIFSGSIWPSSSSKTAELPDTNGAVEETVLRSLGGLDALESSEGLRVREAQRQEANRRARLAHLAGLLQSTPIAPVLY